MKKANKKTIGKLNQLDKIMGGLSSKSSAPKKSKGATFKTGEVVLLLFITMIVSLIMGSLTTYKLLPISGVKLDSALSEFIDNYEYITKNYNGKINKGELIDAALDAMLNKLDRNSMYMNDDESHNFNILLEGSYSGLGVQIYDKDNKIIVYKVYENSPADKAGLKVGDVITAFDGKSTANATSTDLANKIKDIKDKAISITYQRDGKENTVVLKKGTIKIDSVLSKTYEENGKKIGYIAIGIFASNSSEQFKEQLETLEKQNIDSLIIDLRSNSGGYLFAAENIISEFLSSKHVIYQIQKDDKVTKHYSKGKKDKKYKIYILVNGESASASEVMASALSEQYGATLIGEKTFGKGTVQEMQDLKNGDQYKLTTKNWLTSKGVWIEGTGVFPHIEIALDEKFYENPTEANDNQLQKALEQAKKES